MPEEPQDRAVLAWQRDVDLRSAAQRRGEIDAALDARPARLTIDLTDVGFVDSLGIGVLIHARNRCAETGVELVLRGMPPRTRALVDASGLAGLFTFEG